MEGQDMFIVVSTANDRGIGKQRINVSDISTYRPWEDREGNKEQTVIVVTSGKQFVCNFSVERLDKILSNNLIEL